MDTALSGVNTRIPPPPRAARDAPRQRERAALGLLSRKARPPPPRARSATRPVRTVHGHDILMQPARPVARRRDNADGPTLRITPSATRTRRQALRRGVRAAPASARIARVQLKREVPELPNISRRKAVAGRRARGPGEAKTRRGEIEPPRVPRPTRVARPAPAAPSTRRVARPLAVLRKRMLRNRARRGSLLVLGLPAPSFARRAR